MIRARILVTECAPGALTPGATIKVNMEDLRGVGVNFTRIVKGKKVGPRQDEKTIQRMDILGNRNIPSLMALRAEYQKYNNNDMVQAISRIIEDIKKEFNHA